MRTGLSRAILTLVIVAVAASACDQAPQSGSGTSGSAPPPTPSLVGAGAPGNGLHEGLLYGRVTAGGETYEGRLRWGKGDLEATWSDFFDGYKDENPWTEFAPPSLAEPRPRLELFGIEFGPDPSPLSRMFLVHFGDIARVDLYFSDVRVTLKSGATVTLDRFAAGDADDGVRVWDASGGIVDLDTKDIQTVEFLPTPSLADAPAQLHGVVHTTAGVFTGFIQWNQRDSVLTDTLDGRTPDGAASSLPYDTIRAIARQSRESALVTLVDGRTVTLSGTRDVGREHRGLHVDDPRYGRVLIPWEIFERIEFSPGGGGAAYGDFAPGQPLTGRVTTRDGRQLTGRLVYDLDESETIETLDVSLDGVDYAIPFSRIVAIVPPGRAGGGAGRVVLDSGEELAVERSGDLGERNAGMLIFSGGGGQPEYVPWSDIERVDFAR